MRRFELILALVALFAVGWPVVFGVRPKRGIVAGTLSVAVLSQLVLEGYRWQVLPMYVVAFGLAVGDVIFIERSLDWSKRVTRGILGTLGLSLVVALPVFLPVPELPVPSGPDQIGTFTAYVIDRSREETYGAQPFAPRELPVQVWYPASGTEAETPVVWSENWKVVAPAISRNMGLPSWFLNHTGYTMSHAVEKAVQAPGSYPVLIYSHGWEGVRTIALNQIEHLVSNGYIVVAADHTYGAAATVLHDGEVAYEDPAALPDPTTVDEETYDEAATDLVATFAGDIVSILNELELGEEGALAEITPIANLDSIGIYGHSTGGGAAVKVCLSDDRCDAVLGMDPWVEPLTQRDLKETMSRPALYMRSDEWENTPNDSLLRGIAARGASVTYWLGIDATTHNDFTMAPLLSPAARRFGLTGPIPAGRIVPIIDNYLLGFFDVYLRGTGPAALDTVSFPEVSVSVIEP